MTSLHIARTEWKRVTSSRLFRAGIIVVALIPLLYGALYLWAFWDPYGNLDQIPVAIVNLDEPHEADGSTLQAGMDLTTELLDGETLGWVATSASEASDGLADGTYYAVLTIPADFSAHLATADTTEPLTAHLEVEEREYASMIGAQIEDRVFAEVRTAASESTTRSYLDSILLGFSDMRGSLTEASLGADELATGIARAADGASQLADGATSAASGSADLSAGLDQLAAGMATADAGAASLAAGASTLDGGLASADTGAQTLAGATRQIADGASQLSAGVGSLAAGASQTAAGASATAGYLDAYAATHPEALADASFATALAAAHQTSAGAATLAAGLGSAASSAQTLATGAAQAASGSSSLAAGIATARAGSTRLASGARELAAGTGALASGASGAADGARELTTGLGSLRDGAGNLATGLAPAVSGSRELADGISVGAAELPDFTDEERAANAAMMASPIELDSAALGAVPNYGTGFSPYFIPLALWVGALIAYFLLAPLPERGVREGKNPLAAALGGFWPAATLGVVQAVILVLVLQMALGLEAAATPALYLFAVLCALAFVAVLQALNALFGIVGKLLAIVVLMLQLTSAAGTFPIEMLPGFFRTISPYLPMTYAVDGLRQAISSGNMSVLAHDACVLGLFAVGSLLLTSVAAVLARGWSSERLRPALQL